MALAQYGEFAIEAAGGRQEDVERLRRLAEALTKGGELVREVREDVIGRPDVAGHGPQRAGADDDRVGRGAQDRHDEPVVPVRAAYRAATGVRRRVQRDYTVDGLHEVRVDPRPAFAAGKGEPSVHRRCFALEAYVDLVRALKQGL
jgi:hypothetical protein